MAVEALQALTAPLGALLPQTDDVSRNSCFFRVAAVFSFDWQWSSLSYLDSNVKYTDSKILITPYNARSLAFERATLGSVSCCTLTYGNMDFIFEIVQALVALAALSLIVVLIIAHVTAEMVTLARHEKEKYFLTVTGEKELFPSLHDPSSRELSVVIPAYNEELRMPVMLDEATEYLENRQKQQPSFTYEVIVVDDGSKDKTTEVALRYSRKYGADKVRVLTLVKNRGKGGAVRMGTLSSRGKLILMADADGATKFADIEKVEAGLNALKPKPENMAISCGSRAHLEQDSVAQRSMFRTFLMYGFHFLVWFFCVRGIKDTQCGFKLFTREAALKTFSSLHVERWAFDVELLYIAQCFKIPIAEVAVNWTEIEGSKLVPFWSWLQMGRDLFFIRMRYFTRAWKLQSAHKTE